MAGDAVEVEECFRWKTPLSDAKSLGMVTLIQDNRKHELAITLEDIRDSERKRFAITFKNVPAYKNILEEYRLSEWRDNSKISQSTGWTQIVKQSQWLKTLRLKEPLLGVHYQELFHYRIITEDDVIDVLTGDEPKIDFVGFADQDETPPGQSKVYYHPEDREQINILLANLKNDIKE